MKKLFRKRIDVNNEDRAMSVEKYTAIIAAAGLSSRMNDFKPLMKLGDKTLITSVIGNLKSAGVEEFIVVIGHRADDVIDHLRSIEARCLFVINENYADNSMFDSIRLGLEHVNDSYCGIFVTPGDVPLVSPDTIEKLMRAEGDLVVPKYGEITGHPVLIRRRALCEISGHDGSCGLKGAIDKLKRTGSGYTVSEVDVEDRAILMDADTRTDYDALIEFMSMR